MTNSTLVDHERRTNQQKILIPEDILTDRNGTLDLHYCDGVQVQEKYDHLSLLSSSMTEKNS